MNRKVYIVVKPTFERNSNKRHGYYTEVYYSNSKIPCLEYIERQLDKESIEYKIFVEYKENR